MFSLSLPPSGFPFSEAIFGIAVLHQKKAQCLGLSFLPFPVSCSPPQEPGHNPAESYHIYITPSLPKKCAQMMSFQISRRETWKSNLGKAPFSERRKEPLSPLPRCPGNPSCLTSLPCGADAIGGRGLIKRVFFCFVLFLCSEFIDTQKQALPIPGALETGKQK